MDYKYKNAINKIQASDKFKDETLRLLNNIERERRYEMKNSKKLIVGLAVCMALFVGVMGTTLNQKNDSSPSTAQNSEVVKVVGNTEINLLDRIVIDPNAPSACVMVNLEGVIVEVSQDGLSFKLDTGQWVTVTDETFIGVTLPTAVAIEDQNLEPTFRVGNSISGFVMIEHENDDKVDAHSIYTNWNWEDPIK